MPNIDSLKNNKKNAKEILTQDEIILLESM